MKCMRTTYRVQDSVKVFRIGPIMERQVLLELGDQVEDPLVCGDEKFFLLVGPIIDIQSAGGRYHLKQLTWDGSLRRRI